MSRFEFQRIRSPKLLMWVLFAGSLVSSACNSTKSVLENKASVTPPGIPKPTTVPPGLVGSSNSSNIESPQWIQTQAKGEYFQATIRTLSARDEQKETSLNSVARAEKVVAPSDFGYSLFRVTGVEKRKNDLFIVPKILVQSDVFGGRIHVSEASNNQSSVRIPIALVDGLKSNLISGYSTVPLPAAFKHIKDGNALAHHLGYKPILRSSLDCPIHFELMDGKDSLALNYLTSPNGICPRNQFFEVIAEGKTDTLREWFEKRIPNGNVAIYAKFELANSYAVEAVSIDFFPVPIFEDLSSELNHLREAVYDSSDLHVQGLTRNGVHDLLGRHLRHRFLLTGFSGLEYAESHEVIDAFIARFFNVTGDQCPQGEQTCFKLKPRLDVEEPIHFDFVRQKVIYLPGDSEEVISPIHDLSRDIQLFKVSGEQTDDANPPTIGRLGGLLRQVMPGDLVELEIDGIFAKKKTRDPKGTFTPARSKLENWVCTEYGEVPTHNEIDYGNCIDWNQECADWNIGCNRMAKRCVEWQRFCSVPASHGSDHNFTQTYTDPASVSRYDHWCGSATCSKEVDDHCAEPTKSCRRHEKTSCKAYGTKKVPSGEALCNHRENQWLKTYEFSDVTSGNLLEEPLETFDQKTLLSGVGVQFSGIEWDEQNWQFKFVKTTCTLGSLFPEIIQNGNNLRIQFRVQNINSTSCLPFDSRNTRSGFYPELSLVNQLSIPEKIPCGFREDYWNGSTVYRCPRLNQSSSQPIFETYFPRMEIQGRLKLPGLSFISKESGEM